VLSTANDDTRCDRTVEVESTDKFSPPPLSRQNQKLMLVMQIPVQLMKEISLISSLRLFVFDKTRRLTKHSCLERCRIIPPNITAATVSTKTDLSSNQSARLAVGFETFLSQIRKLSDKLVVFGSNDINPTCTSFSVSHTAAVCFVTPVTELYGEQKAKRFAVSFHTTLPSLNKFSPLPLNILAI